MKAASAAAQLGQDLRLAFLGASGSFSEEAARRHAERERRAPVLQGFGAPAEVLAALAQGLAERAVLPIANTTGGLVWPSLLALGAGGLEVVDEIVLTVRFTLLARAGVEPAAIQRVASHPQAFLQCARSLARLLPGREHVPWSDTASAARDLAAGVLGAHTAVLASAQAGAQHRLMVLAEDVQDERDNRTFFAVLRRAERGRLE